MIVLLAEVGSSTAPGFGGGRYGNQAEMSALILKMFTVRLGPQWSDLTTNLRMYSSHAGETCESLVKNRGVEFAGAHLIWQHVERM